jgi:hypothetical protein
MSKRTRTRYGNANPTTEHRRRSARVNKFHKATAGLFNEKVLSAMSALRDDYYFPNIEKLAKVCLSKVISAKVYQTCHVPQAILLVLKGREGVKLHPETVKKVGSFLTLYLPIGLTLFVSSDEDSKPLTSFPCRYQAYSPTLLASQ